MVEGHMWTERVMCVTCWSGSPAGCTSIRLPFNELPLGFLYETGAFMGSLKSVSYVFGLLKTIDPIKLILFQ
jgi:hypothetical protein